MPLYDASHFTVPESKRYVTSWLLRPSVLALYRLLFALYIFVTILTTFIVGGVTHNSFLLGTEFTYFTFLGYWGLGCYFAVAGTHTLGYARSGSFLLQRPGTLGKGLRLAHAVLYASVTVYPFVVTAVFWGFLSKGATAFPFATWSNVSMHALNSVFAFFEIVVPRTRPHAWVMLLPLVVMLAMYLGLTYVSHAIRGYYVYPFLDPSNGVGLVAGAIVGVLVATCIAFAIVKGVMAGRFKDSDGKGNMGILSERDASRGGGERAGVRNATRGRRRNRNEAEAYEVEEISTQFPKVRQ